MSNDMNNNRNLNRAMSIKGFKKSFRKTNEFFSEKIGISKPTGYDQRYVTLERRVDIFAKLVDDSREKTHELLQPNPVVRTKLNTVNNWARIRGDEKAVAYPQPEGILGEAMEKYSDELGKESNLGHALLDLGESLRQMSAYKNLLETNVRHNFIEPFTCLKHNELKSIIQSRKVTEGLRLDYDSQRNQRKHTYKSDQELQQSLERFEQSQVLAEAEMINFLNNERDHINVLQNLAQDLQDYHKRCDEILRITLQDLSERQKSLEQGRKKDFLSAKTRNIKSQIADIVKQDERTEVADH